VALPSEFAPGRSAEAAVITNAYRDLDAAFAGQVVGCALGGSIPGSLRHVPLPAWVVKTSGCPIQPRPSGTRPNRLRDIDWPRNLEALEYGQDLVSH
jgi:hypothetical protein